MRRDRWTWALAVLYPLCAVGTAVAEVQVRVREDGTKVIFNEAPAQRARRLSNRLLAPDSELSYIIDYHARSHDLSPQLVQAVIQVESGYNVKALSRKGAMGLMQLMPGTASELGVDDPYDPDQNVQGGARYLRQQLDRFANLSLALAAYNAGPAAVAQYGSIPPYAETRSYVQKVMGLLGYDAAIAVPAKAPAALREHARDLARERERAAAKQAAAERRQGESRIYLQRGENNRIKLTNVPPKRR